MAEWRISVINKRYIKTAGAIISAAVLLVSAGCGSRNNVPGGSVQAESIAGNDKGSTSVSTADVTLTRDSEYPDYYEQEVRKTIQTLDDTITGDSVSYIFITDTHLDSNEASTTAAYRMYNAVVDVANNSDVDFVCVGGDIYDGRHAEENGKANAMQIIRNVAEILSTCNKPVFFLHGNHDDNSFSAQVDGNLLYSADYIINKEEWYSVTMAYFPQYATEYERGYFYYDLPGKDVRVVCLNMSDSDDTVVNGEQNEMGMYFYGYKDKQIDWLLDKAFAREDCRYLIMSHDAFDYPEGYNVSSNRDTLHDILTAAYTHQNYNNGKFAKDFSSWDSNIVLYNCGHLHMERVYMAPDMGGLPLINTDKGKVAEHGVWGTFGSNGYWCQKPRTAGTITEALFDIVVSKPGELDFVRFGAGDDWQVKY